MFKKCTSKFIIGLVSLLIVSSPGLAQNSAGVQNGEKVVLNWSESKEESGLDQQTIRFLHFDGAVINTESNWLPYYTSSIELGYNQGGKAELSNLIFEPVPNEDQKYLRAKKIKNSSIELEQYISVKRKKSFLEVFFAPIRLNQNTGQYERLVSFELTTQKTSLATQQRSSRSRTYKTNSVLSKGDWYKVAVTEDDIYKVTFNDLVALGISPSDLTAQSIRVFGNGGGMLPVLNSESRIDDLGEIAIQLELGSDNTFNSGDYLLFYGQGQDRWKQSGASYAHEKKLHGRYHILFHYYRLSNWPTKTDY